MGIVYLSNNASTISTGVVPMTNILRRHNSCIGTDMKVKGGWYKVTINATLTSTAGGNATISLLQDGTTIQSATTTIDANGIADVSLTCVVKSNCCSTLSVSYSGAVLTANQYYVIIENA